MCFVLLNLDSYAFQANLHDITSMCGTILCLSCLLSAHLIKLSEKSWKWLTNVCIFWVVLTIFQAWNICFVLSNPLLPQYMVCYHQFVWIDGISFTRAIKRASFHMTVASFLSPLSLSLDYHFWLLSLTETLSADWKATKISAFLAIKNSVSVGSGWEFVLLAPSFREVRARATWVLSRGWRHTVEHKIYTCYDILLVIFVLSTTGLANNAI